MTRTLEDNLIALSRRFVLDRLLKPWGHTIPAHSHEDEFQSAFEYLWERRGTRDPSKGKISTWAYVTLEYWLRSRFNKGSKWRAIDHDEVTPVSPIPDWDEVRVDGEADSPDLENIGEPLWLRKGGESLSEEGEERLLELPARIRPAARLHLAYGATLGATAEHLGISQRTVSRHIAEARSLWQTERTAA